MMPTYLKVGIFQDPPSDENPGELATVYVDNVVMQVVNDEDRLVVQFTYEELKGIMAIMAAEQETANLFIQSRAKLN